MKDLLHSLSALREQLHILENNVSSQVEVRRRVIVKMAKNLQAGDMIDWPGGLGWAEVHGWSMTSGEVTVSGPGNRITTLPARQRVRLSRVTHAT